MKTLIQTIACLAILTAHAQAETDLRPYTEHREVLTQAHQDTLCATAIPSDAYSNLSIARNNLLLVDSDAFAVPHRIQATADREATFSQAPVASKVDTSSIGDGSELQVFVSRREDDQKVSGLTIATDLRDYEQTAHVYSRADANSPWTIRAKNALVFDYSRFMNVRHTSIAFPETTDPEFRIVIEKATTTQLAQRYEKTDRADKTSAGGFDQTRRTVTERPFHVKNINLWHTSKRVVPNRIKTIPYPAQQTTKSTDPKTGDEWIVLDMANEPISNITFATTAQNFSRTVRIATEVATQLGPEWRELAVGQIFSVGSGAQKQQVLAVNFPECTPKKIRVTVENGALAPIQFTNVQPRGTAYEVQFIPSKPGSLTMYYGGGQTTPSNNLLPIERLYSEGVVPTEVELAPAQANTQHRAADGWLAMLSHPAVFGSAVILVIVVLAWALFRAAKQLPETH